MTCPDIPEEFLREIFSHLKLQDKERAVEAVPHWKDVMNSKYVHQKNEYLFSANNQKVPDIIRDNVKRFVIKRIKNRVTFKHVLPWTSEIFSLRISLRAANSTYYRDSEWTQLLPHQGTLRKLELVYVIKLTNLDFDTMTKTLENLEVLIIISNECMTDMGVRWISMNLKKLKTFRLYEILRITTESLRIIAQNMPQLEHLELSKCPEVKLERSIRSLVNLQELTFKGIDGDAFRNWDHKVFASLKNLRQLTLGKCQISNEMILFLAEETCLIDNLKSLNIYNCLTLSDELLENVSKFRGLKTLDISGSKENVSAAGFAHLARLPHLKRLKMQYLVSLNQNALLSLEMNQLKVLDVAFSPNVSGRDLYDVLRVMPMLDVLVFSACTGSQRLTTALALPNTEVDCKEDSPKPLEVIVWVCSECSESEVECPKSDDHERRFYNTHDYLDYLSPCNKCTHEKASHFAINKGLFNIRQKY